MPSQVADILWLRRAWIPMWMSDFIQFETSSLKLAVAWTESSSIQPTVCDPLRKFADQGTRLLSSGIGPSLRRIALLGAPSPQPLELLGQR
jgi:hypothetical protein